MNNWYSKPLGDGIWADVPSEEIRNIFQPIFISAGKPPEMAVFTRHEDGNLHCEWVAYFSPEAAKVAEMVEAIACSKPEYEGLILLAGTGDCWSNLFE